MLRTGVGGLFNPCLCYLACIMQNRKQQLTAATLLQGTSSQQTSDAPNTPSITRFAAATVLLTVRRSAAVQHSCCCHLAGFQTCSLPNRNTATMLQVHTATPQASAHYACRTPRQCMLYKKTPKGACTMPARLSTDQHPQAKRQSLPASCAPLPSSSRLLAAQLLLIRPHLLCWGRAEAQHRTAAGAAGTVLGHTTLLHAAMLAGICSLCAARR